MDLPTRPRAFPLLALLLPLLAFQEEPLPVGEKPKEEAAKSRLDLYGDPLPEGAVARMGTVRFRHGLPVNCIAFSPDGQILASAGANYREPGRSIGRPHGIQLWDASSGRLLRELKGRRTAKVIAFSPSGETLASTGGDYSEIELWDLKEGKEVERIKAGARSVISYSSDGRRLGADFLGRSLRVWDVASEEALVTMPVPGEGWVVSLALSPDSKTIAAIARYHTRDFRSYHDRLLTWDSDTGKPILEIGRPGDKFHDVAYSAKGDSLATGSADGAVRVWDPATGKPLVVLEGHKSEVCSVAFSPDARILASGDKDGQIRLWSLAKGVSIRSAETDLSEIRTLTFSPDGSRVAAGGRENVVRVWEVSALGRATASTGHVGTVSCLAFSSDGALLFTGSHDGTVRVWGAMDGKELRCLKAHERGVSSIAVSANGGVLVSGSWDETIRAWEMPSGTRLRDLIGHIAAVTGIALVPDGKTLVSGSRDCTIRKWDLTDGKEVRQFSERPGGTVRWSVQAVAMSPDGGHVATGSVKSEPVVVWDLATGDVVRKLRGHDDDILSLAFSHDGRLLACGAGDIRVFDVETGQELFMDYLIEPRSLAFSPDGRLLAAASASSEKRAVVYEIATGERALEIRGHRGYVHAVSFSPDSRYLATAGTDTTALLWDLYPTKASAGEEQQGLTEEKLRRTWNIIAEEDSTEAFRAIRELVAGGDITVGFFNGRMSPTPPQPRERVARLIDDLDDGDFSVRDRASRELELMGTAIVPTLHAALTADPAYEQWARLKALLTALDHPVFVLPGDRLRTKRAIQVLEMVGSAQAKELLGVLADGEPGALQTRDAKAALERLEARRTSERSE